MGSDPRKEREQAVREAALEERKARRAMEESGPAQPGWTEAEEAAHRARVHAWRRASRGLVEALFALDRHEGAARR